MTAEERLAQIDATLTALRSAWPAVLPVLQDKAQALTAELIGQDNEQTRGRIKQLRELMELPETLHQEREGIRAGLAE
jgi:hypothetical protein